MAQNMSMLLSDAVQSVPSPTGVRPWKRASGNVRASIFRLLAGQWQIAVPSAHQPSRSLSSR